MNDPKEIRFIDPHYNELFRIPDGGYITITRPDGEQLTRQCRYMGESHLIMEGNTYHICELAEKMEAIGAVCKPEPDPEMVSGYRIKDRVPVGDKIFVLGHNPFAVEPFVTWQGHKTEPGYDWGHYFKDKSNAEADLVRRVYAERTDTPYKPPTEKKNREQER